MASLGGLEACQAKRRQAALRRIFALQGVGCLGEDFLSVSLKQIIPQKNLGINVLLEGCCEQNYLLFVKSLNVGKEKERN